jgi:hypothetical protein
MGTELATTNGISEIVRMAEIVAKSKLFGVKSADEAAALMLIAQAEGLHPAIAARDYHIISGRPALKADAMLSRFQTAGGSVKWITYTDAEVKAEFSHAKGGSVTISWDMARAQQAGVTGNQTWKKYPRQMLRARCISEGIRTVYPGCVVGTYTPEEVEDMEPVKPVEVQPESVATVPPKERKITMEQAKAIYARLAEIGKYDKAVYGSYVEWAFNVKRSIDINHSDFEKWLAESRTPEGEKRIAGDLNARNIILSGVAGSDPTPAEGKQE